MLTDWINLLLICKQFNDMLKVEWIHMAQLGIVSHTRPVPSIEIIYRVAQKNGAILSHCKYSENSITELRGNWWTFAIFYAEHSH